ncbi:SIS domain-containing protein [Agromyces bracchium]|uniref:SIS domain-containing protein n=1 Tax=Agromyces bracchium TaxID=88376 RepID=A0A6I3M5G2_9MICO|nr:SIS domain-containing protein [Agromyces bracchium]MTH69860.1 SIS domain-containing protein [Agromyces bracchium]
MSGGVMAPGATDALAASVAPAAPVAPDEPLAPGALMRAEIAEQPARWRELIPSQRPAWQAAVDAFRAAAPELVAFVARGSSDHAAVYGQYLVQQVLGRPALLTTPSLHSVLGATPEYPAGVQVAISQSGRSPDLVATAVALRGAGLPLVSITNDVASGLARLADVHLDLAAGPERSVAATKSYTAELLAVHTLVRAVAGEGLAGLAHEIDGLATRAERVLVRLASELPPIAEEFAAVDRVMLVGRAYSMATAKEGALKLMETSGIAASGWSAADAAHGPLGQVDDGTLVIALTGTAAGRESVVEFAAAAMARGARILEIGPAAVADSTSIDTAAGVPDELVPMLEVLPLQVLAAELSSRRGMDPDRPAGLSKVTMTR